MRPFGQWFHDFTPKPTKEWLDLKAWKEKRIAEREDYNTEGEDDVQCCVCEDWFTPDYEFNPEDDLNEEHYCGKDPNCCPLGTIMRFYQTSAPTRWTKLTTNELRLRRR